jgi:hypothetical protein
MMLQGFGIAYGQETTKLITLNTPEKVMKVNNKDLKDITVHVTNNDKVTFTGYLSFKSEKGAKVATKDSVAIKVEPGKEVFVPSKIYINQGAKEGSIMVSVSVKDNSGNIKDSLSIKFILSPSRLLTLSLEEDDMVLPKSGTNLEIPIRVANGGNVAQGGTLVIAFPSALKDKSNQSIKFALEPFRDTVIVFKRKVNHEMVKLGYMDVTVNGIYDDGNIFGADFIVIQSLSSKRTFDDGNGEKNGIRNNVITVGVQNAFDNGETYYLRSRGDYAIKDGRIDYNFNMTKWKYGSQSLAINGTNLDMQYKSVGARLGNITQNGELSFTGRGGELFAYTDSAKKNRIFAGYLDKSINLYSNDGLNINYGNSSWLGYKYDKNSLSDVTTFSHDLDNINKVRSELLVSNLTWKVNSHFATDIKGAIANSVSTSGNDASQPSFAGGLNFYGNFFKNLSVNGNNAYATAYYPGIRRGTLYLNESGSLRVNKSTFSGSILYSNAEPKYMNQVNPQLQSVNSNTTADLTYTRSMGSFGISLTPQYYKESGNWFYNNNVQDGDMTAGRLSTLLTYNPVKIQQSFYLKTDVGGYRSNFQDQYRLQFKSILTYGYRNFRMVGSIQKGDYYLSEVFQEHFSGYNSFRLNVGPTLTSYFFSKTLRWDAGIAYNKDFYSSSVLINSNVTYTLGPVAFFSMTQYNFYSNSHNYKNIQFGLNYYLPENQPGRKPSKGKIELFIFYDLNRNGTFDTGDSIASGILVHIGKTILQSGKDGRISYTKLPPGNYSIYLPTQNGWYGNDQFLTLKEKETKTYSIPMSQTGAIHGNISYQYDTTYSAVVTKDKAWLTIVATNQEGKKFETKTDESGSYHLFLPVGIYTIIVDNLPNQIDLVLKGNNVQPLRVESGKIITDVDFILKVKQRKVAIKKFGGK